MNWVSNEQLVFNEPANIDELTIFHDIDYLRILQKAEKFQDLELKEKKKYKWKNIRADEPYMKRPVEKLTFGMEGRFKILLICYLQNLNCKQAHLLKLLNFFYYVSDQGNPLMRSIVHR